VYQTVCVRQNALLFRRRRRGDSARTMIEVELASRSRTFCPPSTTRIFRKVVQPVHPTIQSDQTYIRMLRPARTFTAWFGWCVVKTGHGDLHRVRARSDVTCRVLAGRLYRRMFSPRTGRLRPGQSDVGYQRLNRVGCRRSFVLLSYLRSAITMASRIVHN